MGSVTPFDAIRSIFLSSNCNALNLALQINAHDNSFFTAFEFNKIEHTSRVHGNSQAIIEFSNIIGQGKINKDKFPSLVSALCDLKETEIIDKITCELSAISSSNDKRWPSSYKTQAKEILDKINANQTPNKTRSENIDTTDSASSLPKNVVPNRQLKVFLSYCWKQQPYVLECYEELKQHHLGDGKLFSDIWIDVERMSGNIYAAMSRAVNECDVIVPFISKDYDASDNCVGELSLAKTLRKKIQPILLDDQYDPRQSKEIGAILGPLLRRPKLPNAKQQADDLVSQLLRLFEIKTQDEHVN